jgi:hypothetical protein
MEALLLKRVLVLVEGPTEQAIFTQVFAPDLGIGGVSLNPRVVGKVGHKGGNNFTVVRKDLKALLKQEPESIVTMFFDYYGLDDSWPGHANAKGKTTDAAFGALTQAIANSIIQDMGNEFNPARFIPYVQFYEIESLLFAGPSEMAEVFEKPSLKEIFEQIVKDCGGCESINDGYDTAPSKRIQKHFPKYKKGRSAYAHAYRIAQHIGVERIRKECPKFNEWYSKLEQLSG